MGIPVLILGASGSGKSTSMRNFTPDEVAVLNVKGKSLPFRRNLPTMVTTDYEEIKRALKRGTRKTYVIDDSQYLMLDEFVKHADETGFKKFTDIAVNFYNLIECIVKDTPPDCIVYLLHHTEIDALGGVKAKTVGKMLDEKITVEGLFTIVLLCKMEAGTYGFRTRGEVPAKAPIDMFPERIDNDLSYVNKTIREYYWPKAKQEG